MSYTTGRWQGRCWQWRVGRWSSLLALLSAGCILPQNDHFLTDIPPPRNRPPAILENIVLPSNRLIQTSSGLGCQLVFRVPGVIDPDLNDTIILQWYIDYSPGQPATVWSQQTYINRPGRPLRDPPPEGGSFVVDLDNVTTPLHTLGLHTVEALVSDGTVYNHDPQKRRVTLLDGGTAEDETYAVTYAWFINNTDRSLCPPP